MSMAQAPSDAIGTRMYVRYGWDRMCRGCEHQPADEDKPNGKKPPVKLRWIPSYDASADRIIPNGEPQCPACHQMPYSTERCIFCGQKFLEEDTK